jgi:hypothetical protein
MAAIRLLANFHYFIQPEVPAFTQVMAAFLSNITIYEVFCDFQSIFQALISVVILSQKCHVNMGQTSDGYGATDI